jgi:hypothetical protein
MVCCTVPPRTDLVNCPPISRAYVRDKLLASRLFSNGRSVTTAEGLQTLVSGPIAAPGMRRLRLLGRGLEPIRFPGASTNLVKVVIRLLGRAHPAARGQHVASVVSNSRSSIRCVVRSACVRIVFHAFACSSAVRSFEPTTSAVARITATAVRNCCEASAVNCRIL